MADRTALYRLYDAEDQLLYIGITSYPPKRWTEHERDKPRSAPVTCPQCAEIARVVRRHEDLVLEVELIR